MTHSTPLWCGWARLVLAATVLMAVWPVRSEARDAVEDAVPELGAFLTDPVQRQAVAQYLDRETRGTGEWFGGPGGWPLVRISAFIGLVMPLLIESLAIHFGWLREWFPKIPQLAVTLVNPATLLASAYALYSIWCIRRYQSARAGALALFTCFLCGFVVLTMIGTYFRGPNWTFYWSPAQWPGH